MINLIKWDHDNDSYQIVLEGTSFYYSKKLVIAFRLPGEKDITVRDEQFGSRTKHFVSQLGLISKLIKKPVPEFKELLSLAYKNAIFTGTKNIAMDRMHIAIPETKENNTHVTYNQDNACIPESGDARDVRQGHSFDKRGEH